jgi:hypothetical protein
MTLAAASATYTKGRFKNTCSSMFYVLSKMMCLIVLVLALSLLLCGKVNRDQFTTVIGMVVTAGFVYTAFSGQL